MTVLAFLWVRLFGGFLLFFLLRIHLWIVPGLAGFVHFILILTGRPALGVLLRSWLVGNCVELRLIIFRPGFGFVD